MYRSPFGNISFRKPHELLASAHSSRGNSPSPSPLPTPNLLIDSDSEDNGGPRHSRSQSKSRSRSVSPPWEGASQTSLPLLSVDTRSPYPSSPGSAYDDDGVLGSWRIGEGPPEQGFLSWFRGGKLGRWFWNTQRGWMVYTSLLIALYGVTSLLLLIMNRFILWTGVYKFGYPITTTLVELLFTQFFLCASASITRSFSRSLYSLGLGCIVAPRPKPSKGKRRASDGSGGLREFAGKLRAQTTDGIFSIKWQEVCLVLPLAIVYSLKIMLSNLSFAYTQVQIYQISRVSSLLWTLILTHFFHRSQSLSVTTLSSCITMVLSLAVVSLRPGTRFAIEGFIAGVFSTFFVALYPILLSSTYKAFSDRHAPNDSPHPFTVDNSLTDHSSVVMSGDGKDATRSAWKLLHYTNLLSIMFLLPCALISGELRDISRNCYILDVAFFWLMMLGAGAAAWATFVTGFLLVRASTPLTMVVTTYPRSALQTVLLMGFRLPTWSWVGVLMTWGAGVWYIVGRRRECGVSFYAIDEDGRGRETARGRGEA